MVQILTIMEMVLGVLLIVSVLLQQKGAGLGAAFGGSGGGVQSTRRGSDLFLYRITILASLLFFGIALALVVIE
ncbi:MAG: preprotein translocase subunit SecG [Candidatus Magasanikbacteria bacterium CG_4_10_14_0_2_um_filter_37_12]|uniref:Protein-export membrane protein SecG n=1 Tax=Candidatus Magasanikbacteria bacterium CG_4_10_14_0_2_um_filter_37_12 TaxID=1974637 RepID=A0A2M7V7E8_9BACT|nr:MAG: preprotein translocase subunit SecG [Candidatus Magasanikbacteria bacterium CG_4_10_14_0_2_um_filter_37_12]